LIEQSQTKVTDDDPASDMWVIDLRTENDIQPETANQRLRPRRYEPPGLTAFVHVTE